MTLLQSSFSSTLDSKYKHIIEIINIYANACSSSEKRSLFISKVFDILWNTIAKCKCKDKEIPSVDDIERIYYEIEERGYQYYYYHDDK
jgi:hypothetical protein